MDRADPTIGSHGRAGGCRHALHRPAACAAVGLAARIALSAMARHEPGREHPCGFGEMAGIGLERILDLPALERIAFGISVKGKERLADIVEALAHGEGQWFPLGAVRRKALIG